MAGGNPVFYYGPDIDRKEFKKKLAKLLASSDNAKSKNKQVEEIINLIKKEYR